MKKILIISVLFLCAVAFVVMANVYTDRTSVSNSEQGRECFQNEQLDTIELHKPIIDTLVLDFKINS